MSNDAINPIADVVEVTLETQIIARIQELTLEMINTKSTWVRIRDGIEINALSLALKNLTDKLHK